MTKIDETKITRVEVHGGEPNYTQHLTAYDVKDVKLSIQDGGRTLKVFYKKE